MKVKNVTAFAVDLSRAPSAAKRPAGPNFVRAGREPAGPAARYPIGNGQRSAVAPRWGQAACIVTAEDGSFGVGLTTAAGAVCPVINDHLAPLLIGESALATEKIYDLLLRATASYGNSGVTSHAIAAVDLALWDLKGKLLERPVYELLGGPQKPHITCYATGFDVEWYLELGFEAMKLPLTYGPADGVDGMREAEQMVAAAREQIGDRVDLMLDCWMALDVEYVVRLGEMLRPYHLKWIEDYLLPDQMAGFRAVRRRLPGQGLATGEHWYTVPRFAEACAEQLVDVLQPDVQWMGLTPSVQVCHLAAATGVTVVPHGGMNTPFAQHLVFAMPAASWGERSGGVSQPGEPLAQRVTLPGTAVIDNGTLVPNDAPGFGIEADRDWWQQVAV